MAQQTLWIRIHPRSKQENNPPYRVQRMFIYGHLFEEAHEKHGWYHCSFSDEQWRYLRNVKQSHLDPNSMPVFEFSMKDPRPKAEVSVEVGEPFVPSESPDLTTAELRGDGVGKVVEKVEKDRDVRAAAFDAGEDIAPTSEDLAPAPTAAPKKRPGRPRKISAISG